MTASDTHHAIEAVWRIESARLIAGLARIVRDVGLAEELAQKFSSIGEAQFKVLSSQENRGGWN